METIKATRQTGTNHRREHGEIQNKSPYNNIDEH